MIMETQGETRAVVSPSEVDDDREDDAVSLFEMPLLHNTTTDSSSKEESGSPEMGEFEFQTATILGGKGSSKLDESNMCAADEVFFQGQILPLRPSISFWRSQSMDRSFLLPCSSSSSSSMSRSLGFDSRSNSVSRSNSTATSISRSHSTESSASWVSSRASSILGNFYSYPSPKLHLLTRKASSHVPQRRSTSSSYNGAPSGWGLFRLGLLRTPEIELLHDIKQRKATAEPVGGSRSKRYDAQEKKKVEPSNRRGESEEVTKKRGESKIMKLLFGKRFGCKCSQGEAVEPVSSSSSLPNNTSRGNIGRLEEDGSVSRRRQSGEKVRCLGSRTFQWPGGVVDYKAIRSTLS